MIDKYIILNRKPKMIVNLFILTTILLTGLVIIWINTVYYQSFYKINSQISKINSYYVLKVLIPVKEVTRITNHNTIWIDSKKYNYKVTKIDNKITYKNNTNYIKIYLEINNLEQKYKIEGYHLKAKIELEKEKITKIIKDKKEET